MRPFFIAFGLACWVGATLAASPKQPRLAVNAQVQQVIRVGPERAVKTIAEASRKVADGDVVEIDAGDYVADVAVWDKRDLVVRAVGGRVRLVASGASAEGKAIWVVRSAKMQIEGFDFTGATVPSRNGAGIRLERGWLVVRDCTFLGNENGILTGNQNDTRLEIENSEFARNGFGDGQSHNLYAGEIAYLSVTGSYFHHANVGHLLKSRAAVNNIRYNRLTDEDDGQASYELEFAAGGIAYVIGNIVQQGPGTNNPHLISYGAEGFRWPANELYLVHNTLVNDRPQGGVMLRVRPGADVVRAENNLLVGKDERLDVGEVGTTANNPQVPRDALRREKPDEYKLKTGIPQLGRLAPVQPAHGFDLNPRREFTYPRGTTILLARPGSPGALQ